MSQYYVSHEGNQLGPFSLEEIVSKVQAHDFAMQDYIYDEEKSDWVMLLQFGPIAEKLKNHKPSAPPPKVTPMQAHSKKDEIPQSLKDKHPEYMVVEWYVLKGENKFGPFAYTDVVKMLQQKIVFEFDFAWHQGLQTWKRIADFEAFHPDLIKKLQGSLMPDISEVFFRRRHRRLNYGGTVLIHDNKSVWKGQGVEISAGGAGVIMENSMVAPGQTLYLHFKPCEGVPAFNAICEVVSKKYEGEVTDKDAPVRYGLKFTSVSANTQKFLQELSKKPEAA